MAPPNLDTPAGYSFSLEYDGVLISAIQEVSGLKLEQDVIELKQSVADGSFVIKKLPGRKKAGEITLTRSLTADNSFEKLWVESSQFDMMTDARKNAAVIVFDYEGTSIKRYNMTNAWPKSLEIGSLKAGDTSVLTEKLVITFEEISVDGS